VENEALQGRAAGAQLVGKPGSASVQFALKNLAASLIGKPAARFLNAEKNLTTSFSSVQAPFSLVRFSS